MLAELADKIAAIERRFSTSGGLGAHSGSEALAPRFQTGWPEVDAALGGGLIGGALHEWLGLAFSASESRRLPWTPPLCILTHLACQAMAANSTLLWTVWIGSRCFPYPRILVSGEGKDRRLLERSIFVSPRDPAARLWAIDLALRSPAVGVVVADGSQLPMAATRRIHLVAKANHTLVLAARPPWERAELSAAESRWLVRWRPSSEVAGPARPRWSVELLRCKGMQPETISHAWNLEWDCAQSAVRVSAPLVRQTGDAKTNPSSAAVEPQQHLSA